MFWLLRSGTDPDYFSPLEVAWSAHLKFRGATNARINSISSVLRFEPDPATRDEQRRIVHEPATGGTKLLDVDLLGNKRMIPFTLFLPVRADATDAEALIHRYEAAAITHYDDLAALRAALDRMPCCASTADGDIAGQPLNVVWLGISTT